MDCATRMNDLISMSLDPWCCLHTNQSVRCTTDPCQASSVVLYAVGSFFLSLLPKIEAIHAPTSLIPSFLLDDIDRIVGSYAKAKASQLLHSYWRPSAVANKLQL